MRKTDIYMDYENQAFVKEYPIYTRGEDGNDIIERIDKQTIARVSTHCSKRAFEALQEMYSRATVEEMVAIAAIAKSLAEEKLRSLKKYL